MNQEYTQAIKAALANQIKKIDLILDEQVNESLKQDLTWRRKQTVAVLAEANRTDTPESLLKQPIVKAALTRYVSDLNVDVKTTCQKPGYSELTPFSEVKQEIHRCKCARRDREAID